MRVKYALLPAVLFFAVSLTGCADYGRVPLDQEDPFLTTTGTKDLEQAVQEMARDMVRIPEIATAEKPPRIAFEPMRNESPEPVNTLYLQEEIRTLLLQHATGKFRFLDREITQRLINERELKREGKVTSSGNKELGGADYFLTGSVTGIDKTDGKVISRMTAFRFRLTDAESSDIIWEGVYKAKMIGKSGMWER